MSIPSADPADVSEQQRSAAPEAEQALPGSTGSDLPLDADPADVAEQQAALPVEDDDRRG